MFLQMRLFSIEKKHIFCRYPKRVQNKSTSNSRWFFHHLNPNVPFKQWDYFFHSRSQKAKILKTRKERKILQVSNNELQMENNWKIVNYLLILKKMCSQLVFSIIWSNKKSLFEPISKNILPQHPWLTKI